MIKTSIAAIAIVTVASVSNAEPLRLGMTAEPYMPYTEVNAAGEWIGLEADLSRALCAEVPDGCEFKQMAWEALLPSLGQGKLDFAIGAFAVTDERREVVDFSTPYYTEGSSLVGLKSDSAAISLIDAADGSGQVLDPASMSGKVVGVQTASVESSYMSTYLKDVEIKSYDTADNSFADLAAARIDYVLAPNLFVADLLSSERGAGYEVKLVAPYNPVLGEGVAYAIRKGDRETLGKVDGALDELRKDGTLAAILAKWIPEVR